MKAETIYPKEQVMSALSKEELIALLVEDFDNNDIQSVESILRYGHKGYHNESYADLRKMCEDAELIPVQKLTYKVDVLVQHQVIVSITPGEDDFDNERKAMRLAYDTLGNQGESVLEATYAELQTPKEPS